MKKLLTFIFAILVSYSFAQWEPQSSGTNEFLESVCFTDSVNGWIVGSGGIILHTSDGGLNWEVQTVISDNAFSGVHFTDTSHGWVVGRSTTFPFFGVVYYTIDGGNNWEGGSSAPFWYRLCGVYFTDLLNGFIVGNAVYHTVDGGETWESQFYSTCKVGGIHFTDSLNGWIAGSSVNGSTGYIHSIILHTDNGGNTWDYQYDYNGSDGYFLYSIYFTDSLKGWAAGGYPSLWEIILMTTDGGNTWDTSYYSSPGILRSIYFADTFNGWAVGVHGTILHTSDAGNTWGYIPSGIENTLTSVYFTESGYGWAVGGNGTILHADYSQLVGRHEFADICMQSNLQSYPNPFSTSTTIKFELKQPETVTLTIFNHLGKQVESIQQNQSQGKQQISWNASGQPSGVYYFRIQAGEQVATGKLLLVR